MYSCPSMPPAPCPPDCSPSKPKNNPCDKYYREIGTAVIGNQLIIRMEREKGKSKKSKMWDPPCDCDVVEIQRPTRKEGPKILKGADNNRIMFRVESSYSDVEGNYCEGLPQTVFYEVGQCKGGPNTNNQCRTVTFYPVADGTASQEVHTDHLTDGNENVFLLKVKKRPETAEEPRRHVELEMRTPRAPSPPPSPPEEPQVPKKVVIVDKKQSAPEEKPRKEAAKKKSKKKN